MSAMLRRSLCLASLGLASMIAAACSGAFAPELAGDGGTVSQVDASTVVGSALPNDASSPPLVDATTDSSTPSDAAPPCTSLSFEPGNGRTPVVSGLASLTTSRLTLLPASELTFNQSGTAVFTFPASTRVTGSYKLVVGQISVSGHGDGAAMALYPSAPGPGSRALLGVPAGPGVGVFFESMKASMSANQKDYIAGGDFVDTRPTASWKALTPAPFSLEVQFSFVQGVLTLDGVSGSRTSIHRTVTSLAFGAACTMENPQGFAITDFSAKACP
jgi:hypothetical protein